MEAKKAEEVKKPDAEEDKPEEKADKSAVPTSGFSVPVTVEALNAYEKNRLAQIKWFAENTPAKAAAPKGWALPKLNPDGSEVQ